MTTQMEDGWERRESEPHPSCKTPQGCRENGCLGWCDEYKPEVERPLTDHDRALTGAKVTGYPSDL